MGDVVNLRRARKTKARVAAAANATEQRFRFGETRAAKTLAQARERAERSLLDGAKLSGPGEGAKPQE